MGYHVIIYKKVGICKRCSKGVYKLVYTKSAGKKKAGKTYGRRFHIGGCHVKKRHGS
jgi:hypothetical protein